MSTDKTLSKQSCLQIALPAEAAAAEAKAEAEARTKSEAEAKQAAQALADAAAAWATEKVWYMVCTRFSVCSHLLPLKY